MSIEAMKQALEALEMYLTLDTPEEANMLETDITPKAIVALKQAIEQANKQEPVAWMWQHDETGRTGFVDMWQLENGWKKINPRLLLVCPLYATPPKPEWVGLTDEEIQVVVNKVASGEYQYSDTFARAIEAKLKEKNT
jgi:hypothetical protein